MLIPFHTEQLQYNLIEKRQTRWKFTSSPLFDSIHNMKLLTGTHLVKSRCGIIQTLLRNTRRGTRLKVFSRSCDLEVIWNTTCKELAEWLRPAILVKLRTFQNFFENSHWGYDGSWVVNRHSQNPSSCGRSSPSRWKTQKSLTKIYRNLTPNIFKCASKTLG